MACVLIPFPREKARTDNFLITASVSLLDVELRKKRWYPHKLAVFWKKRKAKYSTKPVAWFGGIKNGNRGVHVWPEPDPVDSKLTLLKNQEEEMTEYQEKQWNIFICNVSHSVRHQLLATGCIDISNYIKERPGKLDVTVTLKPAIKKVVSGKIEFELSWVMQENDQVIHPTDEEIWEEIMQEVREEQARRKAEGKTAKYKSLKKRRSRKRGCSSGTDITAEEDKKKDKNTEFAENNEFGGSSGTDIAPGEDKKKDKNNEFGCSSGTDIAPGEDKKKDKNNEFGCSSGTDIAAEEDKKSNEQQGGIFPSNRPQMDPSSGSNTKVRPGKFRRQASPHHAPHNSVLPKTYPSVSQVLPSDSEEKKEVLSKRKLRKTVRFQIDGQPEVLHPGVDDEEALDTLSVLRDENSCKLCFVFASHAKGTGAQICLFFFFLLDLVFSSGSQLHSELASYVEEELKFVEDELFSSKEVCSKVKLEMQKAMSSDHQEKFESLNQSWLILDRFHSKAMKRKDLLALDKGKNIGNCLNLLCSDLRGLSEVKGWWKTDQNIAQEKRVAELIDAI
ncbi:unnamed protein product, partial [Pocillopora meandrina]